MGPRTLSVMTCMFGVVILTGCRSTKNSVPQAIAVQPAPMGVSAASVLASTQPMDSNLAAYLPNENEIDEPADDYPPREQYKRPARAKDKSSSFGSGCQGSCCR